MMTQRRHVCADARQETKGTNRAVWEGFGEGLFTKVWEENTETLGALKVPRTNRVAWIGKGGASCQNLGTERAVKGAGSLDAEKQPEEPEPGNACQAGFSSRPLISRQGFPGRAQKGVRSQENAWQ